MAAAPFSLREALDSRGKGPPGHDSAVSRTSSAGKELTAWEQMVEELGMRAVVLGDLLDFYENLGSKQTMPDFDPDISTTRDVVRTTVIPQSKATDFGDCALAVAMQRGRRGLPQFMVTHNWANLFADLVAAIVAHALGRTSYIEVAALLRDKSFSVVGEALEKLGVLDNTYWICAFCVNQHKTICGAFADMNNPERDAATRDVYKLCPCPTEKHFSGDLCEANKFDDMMKLLNKYMPCFHQVVAVDRNFDLFSRAWCVAELIEAKNSNMKQTLMICDPRAMYEKSEKWMNIDVNKCQASRPADKEGILAKIKGGEGGINKFNKGLQELVGCLAADTAGSLEVALQLAENMRLDPVAFRLWTTTVSSIAREISAGSGTFFYFLIYMAVAFALMSLLHLPLLTYCMVGTSSNSTDLAAQTLVTNLGDCSGDVSCSTFAERAARKAAPGSSTELAAVIPAFAVLDICAVAVLLLAGALFHRLVKQFQLFNDDHCVELADFTLCIKGFDPQLTEEGWAGGRATPSLADDLRSHFDDILLHAGGGVALVEVVPSDGGALSKARVLEKMKRDVCTTEYQLTLARERRGWLRWGLTRSVARWEALLAFRQSRVLEVRRCVKDALRRPPVPLMAFVTFRSTADRDRVLAQCQNGIVLPPFGAHRLVASSASPPQSIIWEDLRASRGARSRQLRRVMVFLVVDVGLLLILVLQLVLIDWFASTNSVAEMQEVAHTMPRFTGWMITLSFALFQETIDVALRVQCSLFVSFSPGANANMSENRERQLLLFLALSISNSTLAPILTGFLNGYTEETWLRHVGQLLVSAAFIRMFLVPVNTMVGFLIHKIKRQGAKRVATSYTQAELNLLLEPLDFSVELRIAERLSFLFMTATFGSVMPAMTLIGFGYFVLAYWYDKFFLLHLAKRPPAMVDGFVFKWATRLALLAACLHCLIAVLFFAGGWLLPSGFIGAAAEGTYDSYLGSELGAQSSSSGTTTSRAVLEHLLRNGSVAAGGVPPEYESVSARYGLLGMEKLLSLPRLAALLPLIVLCVLVVLLLASVLRRRIGAALARHGGAGFGEPDEEEEEVFTYEQLVQRWGLQSGETTYSFRQQPSYAAAKEIAQLLQQWEGEGAAATRSPPPAASPPNTLHVPDDLESEAPTATEASV